MTFITVFVPVYSHNFYAVFFCSNLNLFLDSQKMCSIIDGFPTGVDKLTKVFSAASLYYNYSGTHSCFDIENDSDPHGLHGWDWQVNSWSPFPYICIKLITC